MYVCVYVCVYVCMCIMYVYTVNVKKTKSMIFGTTKKIRSLSNLDLKMQNMSLSQVTSGRYLEFRTKLF